MNNLHRELAPVSAAAWSQLEEEAARTIKAHLAGRRVVDVEGPAGPGLAAVGTGHVRAIDAPRGGVEASRREVTAVVEFRVPFEVDRHAIDDVERGATDSDWQPVKDAARQLALSEDHVIFDGYPAAGITGIRDAAGGARQLRLPEDARGYPAAIAEALGRLRADGVGGPYSVVFSAGTYTAASEISDYGYPVMEHIRRLVSGEIIWAPAIDGAVVLTTRGGDFSLHLGQDVSVGYLAHTAASVRLYLLETLAFQVRTSEAAVTLASSA